MTARRRPKGDGTIFQRADGRWLARLWVDDQSPTGLRRIEVTGRTKREVATKLSAIKSRVDQGQPAVDTQMTFGAYAEGWLATTLPASGRKATTQILYAGLCRTHLLDTRLSITPLAQVRATTVERLLLDLRAKNLADSTVRQIYTVGRAIGDAAVRDDVLGKNPFALVPRPKVGRREATHLEPEQVGALIEAAEGSRYRLLFELMVNTGLRRGEALALRWRDVDLTGHRLFVRGTLVRLDGALQVTEPKSTTARRAVPLSDEAVDVLQRLRERHAADRALARDSWVEAGFVFTTQLGEPCEPRNALRALKTAAAAAGLGRVGLHTLRHSAATVMLSNGVPITVVSSILGHAGIEITVDVYGHVAPHVSQDAVAVLSRALRDGRRSDARLGEPDAPGRGSTSTDEHGPGS